MYIILEIDIYVNFKYYNNIAIQIQNYVISLIFRWWRALQPHRTFSTGITLCFNHAWSWQTKKPLIFRFADFLTIASYSPVQ